MRAFQDKADATYAEQMLKLFRRQRRGELAGLSDGDVRRPNVSSPSDGK